MHYQELGSLDQGIIVQNMLDLFIVAMDLEFTSNGSFELEGSRITVVSRRMWNIVHSQCAIFSRIKSRYSITVNLF